MGVLFSGPQAEFELIREPWFDAVRELGRRGVFVGGPAVISFEEAFAAFLGTGAAVGVGNGTDALFLALKALGVGVGDEVITAANTFIATVEAIHHTGATPVLADCDPDTFLIDLEDVKAKTTSRTKAVIPVHLYGQMVDVEPLLPWAEARGISIVEDSAQAAGARLRGRPAGSWGVLGCFSFYPDKNLGALGDGGAVAVSSPSLLSELRKLRNHGGETRYRHDVPGFNSRLDPLQALALSLKLPHLDEWSRHRRRIARLYGGCLAGTGSVLLPSDRGDDSHVYHLYVVRVDPDARDALRRQLQKKGILTAVQYPVPVHRTPAFAHLGGEAGSFPNAERLAGEIVSLPMHIAMDEAAVETVAREIRAVLGAVQV
ncbi:DegT/DnrJ/EryC1/StrS family aminotransferase [Cohnella zeiphila]|uniref:DegT/DnrJ/EryC1/StrS family aminotransferase n=1 Tax=Cohnella zeiphila TaxID=2761120 RepID=A0A7X0SHD2_9BACL|nr:DegT/DnrJ/EryC1/StrS family aminotransferase [Cohnella zeiphila]MBB6729988.1 DegT/DnrJ/EryC1/StrS family aminotransferase [Cohnella zeiphila]